MNLAPSPPAVLAISSQVARGSVGLRAAGFALERLGVPVWKVPTIYLPWHPGQNARYGPAPRVPMSDGDVVAALDALVGAPFLEELGVILTGYFASAGQVAAVCRAIDRARESRDQLLVICDPVCADHHGTYVPAEVVDAIRAELLPRCDLATPNRFELAILAGTQDEATDNAGLIALGEKLPPDAIMVTSAFGLMHQSTGVLLVEKARDRAILAEHTRVDGAPHGTGDLFSALIAAHLALGAPMDASMNASIDKAMMQATASVFEIVARSVKAGSSELTIAAEQNALVRPMAMVTQRQLARGKPRGARAVPTPLT
ncbi:MAG: PfkB family carbohydrate kinase [Pseudomonadota bacterium]